MSLSMKAEKNEISFQETVDEGEGTGTRKDKTTLEVVQWSARGRERQCGWVLEGS